VKPTIVLVHAAFAESSWVGIIDPLQRAGTRSSRVANPLRGVASGAQYVTELVPSIEGPVVLVGHSYGESIITNAARDAGDIV
jgi:hypothetical protein